MLVGCQQRNARNDRITGRDRLSIYIRDRVCKHEACCSKDEERKQRGLPKVMNWGQRKEGWKTIRHVRTRTNSLFKSSSVALQKAIQGYPSHHLGKCV